MNTRNRAAFTLMELTFTIAVIGILAAIAIPKMAATRDDAVMTQAISTVSAVRSALATTQQKNILKGSYTDLTASDIGTNFSNLLSYKLKECSTADCEGWSTDNLTFTFHGPTGDVVYKYQNKKLECTSSAERCKEYGDY